MDHPMEPNAPVEYTHLTKINGWHFAKRSLKIKIIVIQHLLQNIFHISFTFSIDDGGDS